MKWIERLKDTLHMVRYSARTTYTFMQALEKHGERAGMRYNYAPDYHPSTYEDIANIICLFNVKRKAVPSFLERFKYYWKFYKR